MTDRVGFGKNGAYFSSLSAGTYYGPNATSLKSGNFVVAKGETLFLSASNMVPGDTIEVMQIVDGLATPYYPLPLVRLILKDTTNVIAVGFPGTYCMVMSAPALGRVGVEVTIDCDGDYCCWLDMYKKCWNRAPVVLSTPDKFQQVGDVVSYDASQCFFDPDGDTLTYTAVGAVPAGLTLDPVTGIISGTLTTPGETVITVLADDGNGGLSTCDFTVGVNQPPTAPVAGPFSDTCTAGDPIEFSHGGFVDADNDPLALSISGLPTGLSFVDNGGGSYTISGICPIAGTYTYTVTGRDGNGGTVVLANNTVISDAAPLCPVGQTTTPVEAGKAFTFITPQVTDPTGGAVALVASGVPAGMAFTDNGDGTGTISGPMTVTTGIYIVRITVTDSVGNTCTFTVVLESLVANLPPVCPANVLAPNGQVGVLYALFTNTVIDPESGPLSLSASNVPAGLVFTDNGDGTGSFNGTPQLVGTKVVTITATDDNGNTCTFTVTIIVDPAAASLTCPVPQTTTVANGSVVNLTTAAASDTGGGPITLAASNVPAGLAFTDNGDGTGTFTGTINVAAGITTVVTSIQATGGVPVQNCFITVNFNVTTTATPPVCPVGSSTSVAVGTAFSVTTSPVVTPGGGPITLTAGAPPGNTIPSGVIFTDNGDGTGTFAGTATAVGAPIVEVVATSADGTCTFNQGFVFTGGTGNIAPACPANQSITGAVGAGVAFTTPAVTDADGDPITLAAAGIPGGVTFTDNGNGAGTFAGVFPAAGSTTVTITATDPSAAACTFDVVITATGAGNNPPVCPVNQATSGTVGAAVAFTTPAVTDADGDPISLAASGLPGGVTFTDNGNGTGTFGGVFPAASTSTVTITAADGNGGSCTFGVVITSSAAANTPPACPVNQSISGPAGTALSFTTPAVTDADGDPISLASVPPGGVTFADNGDGTGLLGGIFPAAGVYTVTVSASDGQGGSCTFDVVVTSTAVTAFTVGEQCGTEASGGAATFGWTLSNATMSTADPNTYAVILGATPAGGVGPYSIDFSGVVFDYDDLGLGFISGGLNWDVEVRATAGAGAWTSVASGVVSAGTSIPVPASAVVAAVPTGGEARFIARPVSFLTSNTTNSVGLTGGKFVGSITALDSLSSPASISTPLLCGLYDTSFTDV